MKPPLIEISNEFADRVDLRWVDASTSAEEVRALGAMATPTLIGFRGGEEAFRFVGRRTAGELHDLFGSLATGAQDPSIGGHLRVLRGLTAAVLIGLGLAVGAAWPMVIAGLGVASWVIVDLVKSRR
jgi:hypothetical protein